MMPRSPYPIPTSETFQRSCRRTAPGLALVAFLVALLAGGAAAQSIEGVSRQRVSDWSRHTSRTST
jgi:hypothetical protein